jgi:hypothetical protein
MDASVVVSIAERLGRIEVEQRATRADLAAMRADMGITRGMLVKMLLRLLARLEGRG